MEHIGLAQNPRLSLEQLARLQRTLLRRARELDAIGSNLWTIGFGPKVARGRCTGPLSARYLVHHKHDPERDADAIPREQDVRLFDRPSGVFRSLRVASDVEAVGSAQASGVSVRGVGVEAAAALVVRWSDRVTPSRQLRRVGNYDWRWGLITVAHLLRNGIRSDSAATPLRIDRLLQCADDHPWIGGEPVASGRLPGGPDVLLLETGRDALVLSGMLDNPAVASLPTVASGSLSELLNQPAAAFVHGPTGVFSCRLGTYIPSATIEGLGRLNHLIRFQQNDRESTGRLIAGTSGSVLTYGGRLVAMQIASEHPDYRVGVAQLLEPTLGWLASRLGARFLEPIAVLSRPLAPAA